MQTVKKQMRLNHHTEVTKSVVIVIIKKIVQ